MFSNSKNILSINLLLAHLFTDAIAAFNLVSIGIILGEKFSLENIMFSKIFLIVILYNILAFGGQMFIGYFFDKIKNTKLFYDKSLLAIILSFFMYILGLIFLSFNIYLSIIFTGIGSCLFHIGGGNISALIDNSKSKYIGIFASGGVVGLGVGTFLAIYNPIFIGFFIIGLIIISILLIKYNFIPNISETNKYKNTNINIIFFILISLFLVYRSGVWSFENSKIIQLSKDFWIITLIAFFAKFLGGIIYDILSEKYKKRFLICCILLSLSTIFWNINIFIFVFLVQFLLSPAIFEMIKIFPNKKSLIIGFSFGMSLVLGGILGAGNISIF